jgi:hypothetical protein
MFPDSFEGLNASGYSYSGSGNCRKCGTRILWYKTPRGKSLPMNPNATTHWSTCPYARDFRKPKK